MQKNLIYKLQSELWVFASAFVDFHVPDSLKNL